jgi:hypothetical protein
VIARVLPISSFVRFFARRAKKRTTKGRCSTAAKESHLSYRVTRVKNGTYAGGISRRSGGTKSLQTPLCGPQATTPKRVPGHRLRTIEGDFEAALPPFFIRRAIIHRPVGVSEFLEPSYEFGGTFCAAACVLKQLMPIIDGCASVYYTAASANVNTGQPIEPTGSGFDGRSSCAADVERPAAYYL